MTQISLLCCFWKGFLISDSHNKLAIKHLEGLGCMLGKFKVLSSIAVITPINETKH